jgi:alanine dehydrogenase
MVDALFLTEHDVMQLVTIDDAIASLETAFKTWGDAGTANLPRQRAPLQPGFLNLMGAAYGAEAVFGLKSYFVTGATTVYHVLLYSKEGLLALIEAQHLSQLRTGAASGVATKVLARPDARVLGIIGTGSQAFPQVAAVCAVRPITTVRVHSRAPQRREGFARMVEAKLGVEALPCASAEACVEGADVVVTITKSAEPVCRAAWLADGVHVNAAGANAANRRELDPETVLRASLRVTDDRAQARGEAAEFIDLVAQNRLGWDDIHELGDVVAGRMAGRRSPRDVTLFKSLGIALEDVAFAHLAFRRALARGIGRPIAASAIR